MDAAWYNRELRLNMLLEVLLFTLKRSRDIMTSKFGNTEAISKSTGCYFLLFFILQT